MNVKQMHTGVRLGVQKMDSAEPDDMLPQEIDYYLNKAVERFVNEQYNYLKNEERSLEGHFVNDNLRTIIHEDVLSTVTSNRYPNSVEATTFPSVSGKTYRKYISGRLSIPSDNLKINLRYIQPKGIKSYITTGENKPIYREYPIIITDTLYVIGDSRRNLTGSENIEIEFLVDPATIDLINEVDCNLPAHTHITIVDMAVQEIIRDLRIGEGQ